MNGIKTEFSPSVGDGHSRMQNLQQQMELSMASETYIRRLLRHGIEWHREEMWFRWSAYKPFWRGHWCHVKMNKRKVARPDLWRRDPKKISYSLDGIQNTKNYGWVQRDDFKIMEKHDSKERRFLTIYQNEYLDVYTKRAVLKASAAVVNIVSYCDEREIFHGSGIVIESDGRSGIILTSATLNGCLTDKTAVEDNVKVVVCLSDGKLYDGQILAYDFHYNLAAIKIQLYAPLTTARLRHLNDCITIDPNELGIREEKTFQLCPHSSSFDLIPGDTVIALGRYFIEPYEIMAAPGEFSANRCDYYDCQELFRAECRITRVSHRLTVIKMNKRKIARPIPRQRGPKKRSYTLDDIKNMRKYGLEQRVLDGFKIMKKYGVKELRFQFIYQNNYLDIYTNRAVLKASAAVVSLVSYCDERGIFNGSGIVIEIDGNMDILLTSANLIVCPTNNNVVTDNVKCGSRGPLINRFGEVIGVTFYEDLFTPFMPINVACKCWEHCKKYEELGDFGMEWRLVIFM